jgi:nitrite reductase/ring-hydroxylating ferredoxin subunit
MARHIVGRVADLPAGSRKIVHVDGVTGPGIGVFNVRGRFYALKNVCPHQGAQICLGEVTGTTVAHWPEDGPPSLEWVREGEILTCPWHRWEIELATGKSVFPSKYRIRTYDVMTAKLRDLTPEELPRVDTYHVYVEDELVVLDTGPRTP